MKPQATLQPMVAIRSSRAAFGSSRTIIPAPSVNVRVMMRPNRISPRLSQLKCFCAMDRPKPRITSDRLRGVEI